MPLGVVVNLRGDPEPPPSVLARLTAVDPGLSLRWSKMNQWALVRAWPPSDRRWQWVQEGAYSVAQAHDIIGYVPNDCDVDQVPAYVERLIREWPVEDAKAMVSRMARYSDPTTPEHAAVAAEAVAEATEAVLEEVTAPVRKRGRRAKVTVTAPEG